MVHYFSVIGAVGSLGGLIECAGRMRQINCKNDSGSSSCAKTGGQVIEYGKMGTRAAQLMAFLPLLFLPGSSWQKAKIYLITSLVASGALLLPLAGFLYPRLNKERKEVPAAFSSFAEFFECAGQLAYIGMVGWVAIRGLQIPGQRWSSFLLGSSALLMGTSCALRCFHAFQSRSQP